MIVVSNNNEKKFELKDCCSFNYLNKFALIDYTESKN